MKKMLLIGLLLSVCVFAQQLTIQGSTTVLPIAQATAEAFMDDNPAADITVRGGGSGTGIAALIDRSTDIASSSRPMKTKEIAKARENGVNPVANIIAMDGIAVIVNKGNAISQISAEDLKKIYVGEIKRWDQLGGGGTIVIISRDAASGTFEAFNELALHGAKLTDAALMLASNLEVARTVAQTPGAIGYVGLGYVSDDIKALKVDGILPSPETINNGTYALARPIFMYTDGKPKGLAGKYFDFVFSKTGQEIVEETGFVPVK